MDASLERLGEPPRLACLQTPVLRGDPAGYPLGALGDYRGWSGIRKGAECRPGQIRLTTGSRTFKHRAWALIVRTA